MQIPIISGVYSDGEPSLRTSYPVNMEPIPKKSGISQGFLRTSEGMVQDGTGPGICRGAIEWNGEEYRVMGNQLCKISGSTASQLGEIAGDGPVTMDYGFTYLAIAGGGNLYLYDGESLVQNDDADLGAVLDVVWIDGYYITTDGEFLVSTELTDPFSVNPLKYASSEEDADPVVAVKKIGTELYAINRHTIETFTNTGGTGFPFQVIDGTQTFRGALGTHAVCEYLGTLAFVGSGRKEQPGVYVAASGGSEPISTSEIETILSQYTEGQLRLVVCETRHVERRELLYVHLPDCTLVYDGAASQALGDAVWFILKSRDGSYRARFFAWVDGQWTTADTQSAAFGHLSKEVGTHWGEVAEWEFSTPIVFDEAKSMIFHDLTLTGLTGVMAVGEDASISMEYTEDGRVFSQKRPITLGSSGNRAVPLKWTRIGHFEDQVSFRFSGDSNSRLGVARLDATPEAMAW